VAASCGACCRPPSRPATSTALMISEERQRRDRPGMARVGPDDGDHPGEDGGPGKAEGDRSPSPSRPPRPADQPAMVRETDKA
jgi:hypothetical protein